MLDKNVLSIIVPVYNGEKYLIETVQNIYNLTIPFQLILVDNNSSDNSLIICKKLLKEHNNILVISEKNKGVIHARNTGLENACGKYVMFVDQDDVIIPHIIDNVFNTCSKRDDDIGFWSTELLFEEGTTKKVGTVYKDCTLDRDGTVKYLLLPMLINDHNQLVSYIGHLWACLYKRSFLKANQIRFKKFIDIEDDYLFLFQCLLKAEKVSCFNSVGYLWRRNLESETYRIKYIPNLYEKSMKYYRYIDDSMSKCVSEYQSVRKKYYVFWKQYTLLRCSTNDWDFYNYKKYNSENLFEILKIKENRLAIKQKPITNYKSFGRRWKILYFLLKNRLDVLAFLVVNTISRIK